MKGLVVEHRDLFLSLAHIYSRLVVIKTSLSETTLA